MFAEIIAVGTELTSGEKLDTNSQWLSLQLAELGIPVRFHTTVSDTLADNLHAFRLATERVGVVLISGGLGPTLDDLTRDALAELAGVELVLHQPTLDQLTEFFRSRGRPMPARNHVQAMFPEGAEPLPNPIGTAPGIWMTMPREGREPCLIAALPGVPSELYKMFHEQVRPRLTGGKVVIRRRRINCFGIGESATEELLGDLTSRGRDPEIGITAHEATITLRIMAHGGSAEECHRKIETVSCEIHQRLGDYVFGVEDEELEDIVLRELSARSKMLTTYECATAGLLAQRLAATHATDPATHNCLRSGTVVTEMTENTLEVAQRLREQFPEDELIVIGQVTVELVTDGRSRSRIPAVVTIDQQLRPFTIDWSGNPAITKSYAVKVALNTLLRGLRRLDPR